LNRQLRMGPSFAALRPARSPPVFSRKISGHGPRPNQPPTCGTTPGLAPGRGPAACFADDAIALPLPTPSSAACPRASTTPATALESSPARRPGRHPKSTTTCAKKAVAELTPTDHARPEPAPRPPGQLTAGDRPQVPLGVAARKYASSPPGRTPPRHQPNSRAPPAPPTSNPAIHALLLAKPIAALKSRTAQLTGRAVPPPRAGYAPCASHTLNQAQPEHVAHRSAAPPNMCKQRGR